MQASPDVRRAGASARCERDRQYLADFQKSHRRKAAYGRVSRESTVNIRGVSRSAEGKSRRSARHQECNQTRPEGAETGQASRMQHATSTPSGRRPYRIFAAHSPVKRAAAGIRAAGKRAFLGSAGCAAGRASSTRLGIRHCRRNGVPAAVRNSINRGDDRPGHAHGRGPALPRWLHARRRSPPRNSGSGRPADDCHPG